MLSRKPNLSTTRALGSAVLCFALASRLAADPGDPPRPLIINNTLYSAFDGYKLRGDHKEVVWNAVTLTESTWGLMKTVQFNFRRVDGNKPPNSGEAYLGLGDPLLWKSIDSCVNMAARQGQYMELLYGGVGTGRMVQDTFVAFWKKAAPRYKNRTHVIYELKNEPMDFSWTIDRGRFLSVCKMVRDSAPNTIIIPYGLEGGASNHAFNHFVAFDSAYQGYQGVRWDFSKSAMAFHHYGDEDMSRLDDIKAHWPCIMDETGNGEWYNIKLAEEKGIAWCLFSGKWGWGDSTAMMNAAMSGGYAWWITPKLVLSATSISLTDTGSATVRTVNDGGGTLSTTTTAIAYQQGSNWLSVQVSGSKNLQVLTNKLSGAGPAAGVYRATVTVTAPNSVPTTRSYAVTYTSTGSTEMRNRDVASQPQDIRLLNNAFVVGSGDETTVRILDSRGRTVCSETFTGIRMISVAGLGPAVYHVVVRTQQGTRICKIVR